MTETETKKNDFVINKTIKTIGANEQTFDFKNLIVQADSKKDCQEMFKEEWKK